MTDQQQAKIIGLDLGEKTIGVAVSDDLMITAQPVETLRRTNMAKDLDELEALVRRLRITEVVVGLPINMNGTKGAMARKAETFSHRLEKRLKIPILLWDERLSSAGAERSLLEAGLSRRKRRAVVDRVAAALILQSYLDSRRRSSLSGEAEAPPEPGGAS